MKRYLIIVITILMAGVPAASVGAGQSTVGGHDALEAVKSHKPASPITVSIDASGPAIAGPGDVVELLATVTSVSGGTLMVDVKLTGGVELLGGKLSHVVKSGSGEPFVFSFTVRLPQSGRGKVRVVARTVDGKGRKGFSGRAVYRFGPETEKPPVHEPEPGKDSKGRSIMQYRLGQ